LARQESSLLAYSPGTVKGTGTLTPA